MRATALTAALLVALAVVSAGAAAAGPGASGAGTSGVLRGLQFRPPGQATPSVDADGLGWALVVLLREDASAALQAPQPVAAMTHRDTVVAWQEPSLGSEQQALAPGTEDSRSLAPFAADARLQGAGSLYVEGRVTLRLRGGDVAITPHRQGLEGPCVAVPADVASERPARFADLCPAQGVAVSTASAQSTAFDLVVEDASVVEWHNATVACPAAQECPSGGPRSVERTQAGTLQARRMGLGYERLSTSGATLTANGHAALIVAGGRQPDLGVNGTLRLPLAKADQACPACMAPDGQTLKVSGDLVLQGVTAQPDGALAATLAGDFGSARIDERPIVPARLLGASAAVAVAAGVALVAIRLLLAPLFTRRSDSELLDQPRRRVVHDTIAEHPGVTVRELARLTGLSHGVASHHITVLARHGKVTRFREGRATRLFPGHGRFDATWTQVAALRDPALRDLHGWLAGNPGRTQAEVVRAMAGQGWTRARTQRGLARLLRAGLAAASPSGRRQRYSATPAAAAGAG